MGRGTHRGFITFDELNKSLGKRNLSDENLEQAFLHILDNSVALVEKKSEVKASIRGFLNKHEDAGLLMGFKFKIQINNEILEYTSYPNEEFIEAIILNEMIFVIDNKMKQMFSCKISTDQFVKTKSELNKFQKILNK